MRNAARYQHTLSSTTSIHYNRESYKVPESVNVPESAKIHEEIKFNIPKNVAKEDEIFNSPIRPQKRSPIKLYSEDKKDDPDVIIKPTKVYEISQEAENFNSPIKYKKTTVVGKNPLAPKGSVRIFTEDGATNSLGPSKTKTSYFAGVSICYPSTYSSLF